VVIGFGGGDFGAVRGYVHGRTTRKPANNCGAGGTVPGDPSKGFENKAMEMAREDLERRMVEVRRRRHRLERHDLRPEFNRVYIGTGNGGPWNWKIRSPRRRQPVPVLGGGAERRHRRIRVALPDHARAIRGTTTPRWT
jgi:quinohemoprotein ethanol dehydrogenase